MIRIRRTLAWAIAIGTCAGCSPRVEHHTVLTEHQRDSIISRSDLPGAAVVGRAMQLEGKAAAHSAQLDSVIAP